MLASMTITLTRAVPVILSPFASAWESLPRTTSSAPSSPRARARLRKASSVRGRSSRNDPHLRLRCPSVRQLTHPVLIAPAVIALARDPESPQCGETAFGERGRDAAQASIAEAFIGEVQRLEPRQCALGAPPIECM
eukprot:2472141-Prymnesium_polylepis.2